MVHVIIYGREIGGFRLHPGTQEGGHRVRQALQLPAGAQLCYARRMGAAGSVVVGRDQEVATLLDFLETPAALPAALVSRGRGRVSARRRCGGPVSSTRSPIPYRARCRVDRPGRRPRSPSRPSETLARARLGRHPHRASEPAEAGARGRPAPRGCRRAAARSPSDRPRVPRRRTRALQSRPGGDRVDDVQWLDPPSAFVLGFALRRMRDEPIAFLFAARAGEADVLDLDRALPEERIQRLVVGPLSLGALQRLLKDRLGLVLSRPKLRRVHELSGREPVLRTRARSRVQARSGPARAGRIPSQQARGPGRRPARGAPGGYPRGPARRFCAVAADDRARRARRYRGARRATCPRPRGQRDRVRG